ncbi:MAG: carbamoyltransferase [Blastocatellia bacterium]
MPFNVIGISAYFHDSACCLLQDGKVVAAAEEERFSRKKHDSSLPRLAFRYCLEAGGITIADVDRVGYYENPYKKLGRQIWMGLGGAPNGGEILSRLDARKPEREIREILGYEGAVEIVDHHHAHAASSFYFSGFPEAAIMTIDGVGEWATATFAAADGVNINIFEEVHFPDSIGLLYSAITGYLGFSVNDGEFKVMGLAPYGKPAYLDQIRTLIHSAPGGGFKLDLKYFDFHRRDRMYSDELIALLGQVPRQRESDILQFHKDVARSLQVVLEEILIEKATYLHGKVGSKNLCMAGGVALNCVANSHVLNESPFERLFVQPASSDAGGAMGAAAVAHLRATGRPVETAMLKHAYLGPAFSSEEISALLDSTGLKAADYRGKESELLVATTEQLAAGKVVGWYHGRMEFGPRALGARSILADPRDPGMRDRINALVKKREAFRPFAPAVLESKARQHFDLDHLSPFMLETCQVNSPLDLPAITHVDGSARVQTVSHEASPRFAALLEQFERQTGCPILLNTSFNMRGEPIVCTPLDAILCFVRSGIDALVLEDFLISRSDIKPAWSVICRGIEQHREAVSYQVYTLY